MHFSAERGLAIACLSVRLSVCPSVTLVICDHIGWKPWKLIARAISAIPSLLVAKRRSTYSQGNMHGEVFLGGLEVGWGNRYVGENNAREVIRLVTVYSISCSCFKS